MSETLQEKLKRIVEDNPGCDLMEMCEKINKALEGEAEQEDEPCKYAQPSEEHLRNIRDMFELPEMVSIFLHDAKKELPESDVDVLVITNKGKYVVTAMYTWNGKKSWKSNWGDSITHWGYLPKAPRKENSK